MKETTGILFLSTLFSILIATSTAVDTFSANQTIRDDSNTTIESASGLFELGFFSPGNSKNRYMGIWYKKISTGTVVWVANRENPLTDISGVLRIDVYGGFVLVDGRNNIIWSSNSSRSVLNPVAQLFDTGNLVIRSVNDSGPENYIWQSFDHPGDHVLPGVKVGRDFVTGLERYATSSKSAEDPSPGNYTYQTSLSGFPQQFVSEGSIVKFRYGPWDGIQLSGAFASVKEPNFEVKFASDLKETYYSFDVINSSIAMRMVLTPDGDLQILRWLEDNQIWANYLVSQKDDCDHFAFCGAYGSCNSSESRLGKAGCGCLEGYKPKFPKKWKLGDYSGGCVRKTKFDCGKGDAFITYPGLKLPDSRNSWFNESMGLEECKSTCLKNCSCTAYSSLDIRQGGIGCLLWFNDLLDIRDYKVNGLNLYVRINASELEPKRTSKVKIIVAIVSVVIAVLLGLFLILVLRKRKQRRKGIEQLNLESDLTHENKGEDLELPLFDFTTIDGATNNFSEQNKLGEGGFGPVYKGILDNGQEIAVKRLSKNSKQGLDEFKNEVSCIARLQHRNLVRLLGCCIKEGEMLLIYEYMSNKSLDSFIFDKELSKTLNWSKRYNIINGIARGLMYLHQDSRLRIIHRDLKASNILLDYEMNPRISDFGMAKIFGGTETAGNTSKVVGTYGYMSPEYALDGLFSDKSDVYSFGVLVLEIVCGRKMRGFYQPDNNHNLLDYAWNLYNQGAFLELIDEAIKESCHQYEVSRTIQIGLLCVNTYPEDRPTMSFVVSMLSNESPLPQPMQPGFFTKRNLRKPDHPSRKFEWSTSNELSVTFFAPR